jgi:RNA polymerase sigma-70 factor (ECF subfamily)
VKSRPFKTAAAELFLWPVKAGIDRTMGWRIKAIRDEGRYAGRPTGEFPANGEAAPWAGLGAGLGGGSGLGGVNLASVRMAKGAQEGSGSAPAASGSGAKAEDSRNPAKSDELDPETAEQAQPSAENRVPEDMATMVLNNSALGVGSARPDFRPEARPGVHAELDPASDAAVMLRVAEGDEASFNFLVQKHHRAMIHFLFRMVRNMAVAEELAQEVFLRVYRARDSYRAEARFTTWLYRIATNLAVNHARDTKHERSAQTVYLDAPDEETGTTPDVADDEPSVEQKLMRDERMAAIRLHVMALPERQRMAVLMHKYQGMDYRQIGDVLKLSESATKSLLFRAYQTLRDKLKDFV